MKKQKAPYLNKSTRRWIEFLQGDKVKGRPIEYRLRELNSLAVVEGFIKPEEINTIGAQTALDHLVKSGHWVLTIRGRACFYTRMMVEAPEPRTPGLYNADSGPQWRLQEELEAALEKVASLEAAVRDLQRQLEANRNASIWDGDAFTHVFSGRKFVLVSAE